ncbi:hypothetical protein K432DRAFT_376944 [Lepidopterella palustris CBS 459.81]|uniref:tRNA (guanine(9)-N1)-methyltransferase n=1 Tax=Lepidopterella palustris CBS 459.81 TaxID=1314670 RepID=A0A8E2ELC3_9PEZI|nr:hypothetical protein K432DRAFT_376944 [Lepidopterella palustris CBS 459.81]
MEVEERPAKIRKVEHTSNGENSKFIESLDESTGGPHNPDNDEEPQTESPELAKVVSQPLNVADPPKSLSKSQLKKIRREEEWKAKAAERKVWRKEKAKAKKERKRAEWLKNNSGESDQPSNSQSQAPRPPLHIRLPITIILDCDFDDLMTDKEIKSLSSQITRSYSDNRNAHLRVHLAISSFGGQLKERFDGTLATHYKSWKPIRFCPENHVQVSEFAKVWMTGKGGGKIAGALQESDIPDESSDDAKLAGEVVYLSSESSVTLERLKPYSTYIIGGLVDHNRYKGLCYKRATELGIKTAKLPIGEYLQMNSRSVLATNHVAEIMLKWLDLGNWGEAFMKVIPKRKGLTLKSSSSRLEPKGSGDSIQDDEEMGTDNEETKTDGGAGGMALSKREGGALESASSESESKESAARIHGVEDINTEDKEGTVALPESNGNGNASTSTNGEPSISKEPTNNAG